MRNRGSRAALVVATCAVGAAAWAGGEPAPDYVRLEPDGTVVMPQQRVPPSSFLSPEGRKYLYEHLHNLQTPNMVAPTSGTPPLLASYLDRMRASFPVKRSELTIGGVQALEYLPAGGVAPGQQSRVLIDLHGGGFMGCWPACAELESIPLASLLAIRVIAVDYRQGAGHHHPEASEDVAKVYRTLLKSYRPEDIGIYGCSAGGMLTAMSVAWFQTHGLPRPGAIAILCAGATSPAAGFGGDADYTTYPLGEARLSAKSMGKGAAGLPYFAGTDANDPMVAPAASDAVLARFPPTLVVTGTRAFELSSAVYTHSRLVKAGVHAELHVWEGMFHGFFYNPDVPESRDCLDVIASFFRHKLGRTTQGQDSHE